MPAAAPAMIERNGEGIVVRTGGRLENLADIGEVVVSTRGAVPVACPRCGTGRDRRRNQDRQRQRKRP